MRAEALQQVISCVCESLSLASCQKAQKEGRKGVSEEGKESAYSTVFAIKPTCLEKTH